MIRTTPALHALLKRRPPERIRMGLVPVRRLLARMGNPQQGLKAIHVAGTNGKGSVIAFMEAMMLAAAIPVAVFTSPHLLRFNERIRINGREIEDQTLEKLLAETLSYDPHEETTFFELTTAAALLHFSRTDGFRYHERGLVLLETGLGGRLDATNVVTARLSMITAIGMDHMDYLGDSLAGIAREKAGIFKPNVPAVIAPGHREGIRIMTGVAARVGSPLSVAGQDYWYTVPRPDLRRQWHWRFRDQYGIRRMPPPALLGEHQYANAALAVAGTRILQRAGYAIPDAALSAGIASARWPGRLEYFAGKPPVWLDGAHNPDAIRALVRFLQTSIQCKPNTPIVLVFSVLNNKDANTMVQMLAPVVDQVFTTVCGGEGGGRTRSLT
ncbi:MAG: bifunctional folylpolyglutamate synthase/dihydrofolate synthase, partial [Magnetococcales bacterium]|nr:bifunctional folylpolyglutamate synthase/dihydrofolate synthase [Magnetococcales bacterium]